MPLHQLRNVKIPAMGFSSEHFVQNENDLRAATDAVVHKSQKDLVSGSAADPRRLPDQEILDSTDDIYFQENVNCEEYELRVSVVASRKAIVAR